MKDKFLHNYRQQPPEAFSQSVKRRLDQIPDSLGYATYAQQKRLFRPAQALIITVGIIFIGLFAPTIIAQIMGPFDGIVHRFGNVSVKEIEVHPDILYAEWAATNIPATPTLKSTVEGAQEITQAGPTAEATMTPTATLPNGCSRSVSEVEEEPGTIIIYPECISLETAIARAGFDFSLPTLIPNDFQFEDEIHFSTNEYGPSMTFFWSSEAGNGTLFLDVSRAHSENTVLLAPGAYKEISVNGRPGIFIYGGWSSDINSWDRNIIRTIRWEQDGIMYNLSSLQIGGEGISDILLKRIAGSVE